MKTQRFNLLTTLIVSALHPNEPQAAGTKWEPTNVIDVQEAESLCAAKYAEKIEPAKEHKVTLTWLQRQDEAKRKKQAAEVEPGNPIIDSKPDLPPEPNNDDEFSDEELKLILDGNVDQVTAELDGLSAKELARLDVMEGAEGAKNRKGVHDAIADAIAALDDEQE